MQVRTHIEHARPEDRSGILQLLTSTGLGTDVPERHIARWVVAREAGQVVACGMLDVAGSAALLRSLAVSPSRRRRSVGSTIVSVLLDDAAELGVSTVFAFTRDAAGFFRRLHWQPARGADAFAKLGIAPYADTPVFSVALAERQRVSLEIAANSSASQLCWASHQGSGEPAFAAAHRM
jgi:N-acetylglutamate synthase-like GNAT family acetyltransferase